MSRQEKVKRFLMGAGFMLGGILGIVGGSGRILPFVIGGIFVSLGLIFLLDKSSKTGAWISIGMGSLFLSGPILGLKLVLVIGFLSLVLGAYLTYSTYKKINRY